MTGDRAQKADTRQTLIDAAYEVFVRRGFARATTREIAQGAGVAEGTIYRHFADKHALFREVFLHVAGGMIEDLHRIPQRAGRGTVRENLAYLFTLVGAQQKRSSSLMASMWADPELGDSFRSQVEEQGLEGFELAWPVAVVADYIRAEQALGRIRPDVDAVEAAAVVVAVPFARGVEQTLSSRFPASSEFPAPAQSTLDILTRGLTSAEG
jgi:AcrR family transcriptional regulator